MQLQKTKIIRNVNRDHQNANNNVQANVGPTTSFAQSNRFEILNEAALQTNANVVMNKHNTSVRNNNGQQSATVDNSKTRNKRRKQKKNKQQKKQNDAPLIDFSAETDSIATTGPTQYKH